MALPFAKNQYLKTQIETASKEQLVVMLFDGIIRFTEQARSAMAEGRIEDTHNALTRAQAIIMELIITVDRDNGGEVASNLLGLHGYAFNCLIVCNMKKQVEKIDEVQAIYRELREGWVGAMSSLGITTTKSPGGPAPEGQPQPVAAVGATATAIVNPAPAKVPVPPTTIPASTIPNATGPAHPATGYGMGKTAILGNLAAPPAAPAPSSTSAMVNAYSAGNRSIA